ncbi:DNA-binding protein [Paenibacillus anseongense]|uniref:DNA-binding protein n=1 Tax=Paenibacillus anseongense TaxID=2682845 RepID=UPI002DB7EB07|nr:DNA-binding protein [Paenibacillus anseongense]MEC0266709.1 DNA-binding protein [Paenibacillus anseongense]
MGTQYTKETLPDVLTASHIASYLGLSRRRVYELFQLKVEVGGIKNFEIGISKRVMKEDLFNWINSKKDIKTKQAR